MGFVSSLQGYIVIGLGLLALATEVYAFGHALTQRPDAFEAAGKKTKQFWLLVLGLAVLIGFVTVFNVLGIFGLLAIVAAGIYLADVKPALEEVLGRGGRNRSSGRW